MMMKMMTNDGIHLKLWPDVKIETTSSTAYVYVMFFPSTLSSEVFLKF